MNEHTQTKAILVSIAASSADVAECQTSLAELSRLLDTAGGETFATVIQTKEKFDPKTCIGSGKCLEIKQLCADHGISLVIFDFELSPSQIKNLEDILGDVEVIDRSMLILDIFALHAKSGEGKLQVELAQLKYTAPRLVGKGKDLSRQEGRIGTRGPGESKLETDRRHLNERIRALESQLKELEQKRKVMRAARDKSGLPKVAIVGYTNAGKSTLLNALTEAGVLAEDKLFATLDATTRRLNLYDGQTVLLTDTVGFIRKLPHHLIKAFRSTLEEVTYSDILMIVCDASDTEVESQLEVTTSLIADLNAADKPILYVYNKCDLLTEFPQKRKDGYEVFLSAKNGTGLEELTECLSRMIAENKRTLTLAFPYDKQGKISELYSDAVVKSVTYEDDCVLVEAELDRAQQNRYAAFIKENA